MGKSSSKGLILGFFLKQSCMSLFYYIKQQEVFSSPIYFLQSVFKPLRQMVNLFLHNQLPPTTSFPSTPGISFMAKERKSWGWRVQTGWWRKERRQKQWKKKEEREHRATRKQIHWEAITRQKYVNYEH